MHIPSLYSLCLKISSEGEITPCNNLFCWLSMLILNKFFLKSTLYLHPWSFAPFVFTSWTSENKSLPLISEDSHHIPLQPLIYKLNTPRSFHHLPLTPRTPGDSWNIERVIINTQYFLHPIFLSFSFVFIDVKVLMIIVLYLVIVTSCMLPRVICFVRWATI